MEFRVCSGISHIISIHEAHQEFSASCHLAEEVHFSLQLAILLFCLMIVMERLFSKRFAIMHVTQQNGASMGYHNHKRHVLQQLTVSAHQRVTAWTS